MIIDRCRHPELDSGSKMNCQQVITPASADNKEDIFKNMKNTLKTFFVIYLLIVIKYSSGFSNDSIIESFKFKASSYFNTREYIKAIEYFTKAIEISKNDPVLLNNRGLCFYNLSKYDLAIKDFTGAIRIDSLYAAPYNNRGIAKYKNQNIAKASIPDLKSPLWRESSDAGGRLVSTKSTSLRLGFIAENKIYIYNRSETGLIGTHETPFICLWAEKEVSRENLSLY